MSGGRLVVLDRQGRDVKYYPLKEGLATLGSDPICDIRFMLPTVSPHHATVSVHTNQSVVHAVGAEPTLVNGVPVSVAALRHGDEVALGGRRLRWEYNQPAAHHRTHQPPQPALARRSRGGAKTARAGRLRRATAGGGRAALVLPLRASMPASTSSTSGKQVAIVQPWGKDTSEQSETIIKSAVKQGKRLRASRKDDSDAVEEEEQPKSSRRWGSSVGAAEGGDSATKASLWCESRRAPRRTPLKIHDPKRVDHTKQAALMLMTGHSPPRRRARHSQPAPRPHARPHARSEGLHSISLLEIGPGARRSDVLPRYERKSTLASPILGSPKKSALKDPLARKSVRKTESIKFDLSNLDGHERSSDVIMFGDSTAADGNASDDELTLHYSESSTAQSPSPKKNSRSSKIMGKSLRSSAGGTTLERTAVEQSSYERTSGRRLGQTTLDLKRTSRQFTVTPGSSPRAKKSLRGSIILKKALENSRAAYRSSRNTRNVSEQSYATVSSASPRARETYSLVDLVSLESSGSRSVYGSPASPSSRASPAGPSFDSPPPARRTRSGKPSLLASSTPYHKLVKGTTLEMSDQSGTLRLDATNDRSEAGRESSRKERSKSIVSIGSSARGTTLASNTSNRSVTVNISRMSTRRSASLTTPENTHLSVSLNSTRAARATKSRSRINDSEVLLLDDEDASPRSSRRASAGPTPRKNISVVAEPATPSTPCTPDSPHLGNVTPENRRSPDNAVTPVLNIQNLLDQSLYRGRSRTDKHNRSGRRKTIGIIRSVERPKKEARARSFAQTSRRSGRGKGESQDEDGIVTPTSAVKLVPEAVKNKHSTAKKPLSKRSIIDTLDESDVVKQLFSSPVKRNLSRSMSDFSRWQDEDARPARPARHTLAVNGRSPGSESALDDSAHIAPDMFVSSLGSPEASPDLDGVKRLFARGTPENDLRDVRGVKALLRTPRARRSIGDDLTRVSGVKRTFARSPRNRLSEVRVKELFAPSPKNDLRRVTGVKALFKSTKASSPDVRGIRGLFKGSPRNELLDVSGVRALKRRSPRNDLSGVDGIENLFEDERIHDASDVSDVEELMDEHEDAETTFDRLIGRPRLKAYGKSTSLTTIGRQKRRRAAKSLHDSIDAITNNVEEWLQGELRKSVRKVEKRKSGIGSTSRPNLSRELQKLSTDTLEGTAPPPPARPRSSAASRDQSALPIKKRSLVSASMGRSGRVEASLSRNSRTEASRSVRTDASLGRSAKAETSLGRSVRAEASLSRSEVVDASLGRSKPAETSLVRGLRLPIKKRLLVHSTPVKGTANATMNTTALGRVSPIAALDQPAKTSTTVLKQSPKPIGRAKRSLKNVLPEIIVSVKSSPKKLSEVKSKPTTPIQPRATRRRKVEVKLPTVIKRRKSITITKKPPVLSPKPAQVPAEKSAQPKRGRVTRNAIEEKPKTPTRTRAKARRVSVVISKPSPQLKPTATRKQTEPKRQTRKTKAAEPVQKEDETAKPTRKTKATENVSNVNKKSKLETERSDEIKQNKNSKTKKEEVVENTTRARRNQMIDEKPDTVQNEPLKRGRKTQVRDQNADNKEENAPKRSRRTIVDNKASDVKTSKGLDQKTPEKSVLRRGRRTQTSKVSEIEPPSKNTTEEKIPPKPKRGRKTETVNKEIETIEVIEPAPKKGRRNQTNTKDDITEIAPRRGRAKVSQNESEPKKSIEGPAKGKKNKKVTIAQEVTVEVKGRQTKAKVEEAQAANSSVKSKRSAVSKQVESPVAKRTTRHAAKEEPKNRGRKTAVITDMTTSAGASQTTTRKRKSSESVAKASAETAKRRKVPVKDAQEQRSTRSRRR